MIPLLCLPARGYFSEQSRATCPEKSHLSFCSPFSPAEFLAAVSNLSSSTATGPDKVAYSMLKYFPRSGMDFLLHIFNLSWSLHSFPFVWKTSSIIPMHEMGKPLDSPASFRPISLTSCASETFERIILSRLLFFMGSNSILSPRQDGFHPGRSTLDQILFLSQLISVGFTRRALGLSSIINFSKAFDSVWHPALFHKLISTGLPLCFTRWTQIFRFRQAQLHGFSRTQKLFRISPYVSQRFISGLVLFSLSNNDLSSCLFSFVSCSFMLTIWLFGSPHPGSLLQWRPHKEL